PRAHIPQIPRESGQIGRSLVSALWRFPFARPDRLEVLPLLDRRSQQVARPVGVGLGPTLELGGGSADQAARRAVAAAIETRVAMRAMHLERAVRLKEAQRLGLGDEGPRIDDQYASTTDFFSRYPSSPSMPCSFPKPDCFVPPNGSWSYATWMSLIHVYPASSSSAALRAFARSFVQIEDPRP